MYISEEKRILLDEMRKEGITDQLLREFVTKDLHSASIDQIDSCIDRCKRKIKYLEILRSKIKEKLVLNNLKMEDNSNES